MDTSQLDNPAEWLELYGDRLFRVAMSRVHDRVMAEDLVQDTFLSALKSIDSFQGRSSVETWLQTILRNKIIDHYRSVARRRGDISLDHSDDLPGLDFNGLGVWNRYISNWARDPETALEDQQLLQVLKNCIEKLPVAHRTIFELRILRDLDQEEICKAAGVTPSNYWVILHRARLALRSCVEKNWGRKR